MYVLTHRGTQTQTHTTQQEDFLKYSRSLMTLSRSVKFISAKITKSASFREDILATFESSKSFNYMYQ